MNTAIRGLREKYTDKFNPRLTNGFATKELKKSVPYLNEITKNSVEMASSPLKFHGIKELTFEELKKLIHINGKPFNLDIARSDLYKVKFIFSYNGEIIEANTQLMDAGDAGITEISGTKYHLVPVLMDTIFSMEENGIFVGLLLGKLKIGLDNYPIIWNGIQFNEGKVFHTQLYKTKVATDKLGSKIVTPALVNVLATYGFKGLIKRYFKEWSKDIIVCELSEASSYDGYHIFHSTGQQPHKHRLNKTIWYSYTTNIAILIKNRVNRNLPTGLLNTITATLYLLDILPRFKESLLKTMALGNDSKDWFIILSRLIYRDNYSQEKAHTDCLIHYDTLNYYIDSISKSKLKAIGLDVDNFFDLLMIVNNRGLKWLVDDKLIRNNVANKHLELLYYVYYDIIMGINTMAFKNKKSSSAKELTYKEVRSTIINKLNMNTIYSISSGERGTNLCLYVLDNSAPFKISKVTAVQELQARGLGTSKNKNMKFPKPTRTLDAYHLVQGVAYNLTKLAPTPLIKTNYYMQLDENNRIILDKKTVKKLNYLNHLLKMRVRPEDAKTEEMSNMLSSIDDIDDK